ncbi:uncharacterized protein LOC118195291 [Stegodyphus dumicola]|uniref:uncharacterized protein LOC118195291 n=1 Tax=Stegodyphus dumicola TaxID=202533 RepID=UPI0015A8FE78|nr:uncharacterized protein LOC118195291 [Stegodyphus dumicola]
MEEESSQSVISANDSNVGESSSETKGKVVSRLQLREILKRGIEAQERLASRRREKLYILLVPGVIRLIEIFLSMVNVAAYGFLYTYYEVKGTEAVPPYFMATSRETYFLMVNYHSLIATVSLICAATISPTNNAALLGSLFLFIFDIIQFIFVTLSAITVILLYEDPIFKTTFKDGLAMKKFLGVCGIILGCLHVVSAIYDIAVFLYVRKQNKLSALNS